MQSLSVCCGPDVYISLSKLHLSCKHTHTQRKITQCLYAANLTLNCILKIFELAYINNISGFIVIIPHIHTMYFEQVPSLHYIPIPYMPPSSVFSGFRHVVFICIMDI